MTEVRQRSECGYSASEHPTVRGKFLFAGDEKLFVRGVTYGTFRPNGAGEQYPSAVELERDFAAMAARGVNAVRTYTVPPRTLLDAAAEHELRVLVGVPWEEHVAFLEDRGRARSIEETIRAGVRACANHPAVLGYAIGNEIPAPIVRWYGRRRIERFLKRLYESAKQEDPTAPVTYVNYPSTEYLELSFTDFMCFNVYLEAREQLAGYLAHLQNIAGDRPLLMAEVGLDSRRHGEETQAQVLDWQVRTAFEAGCAGVFLFSWTDEWYRGGYEIEDWDFGLTDRERRPKAAAAAVQVAFAETPFTPDEEWPRISVVVCTHNGERTLRDCLAGVRALDYPHVEAVLVDDGSTDATAAIGREFGVRTITTDNHGLAHARNVGLKATTGEIVAYLDDDARPDADWLTYLAAVFATTNHVGVGGPNLAPPGDGPIAACVANAPGGPMHVLLSETEAEHIPGCNMAFRRDALEAIGGFDVQFRAAGDDVDVCWRLQEQGWTLGFSPAAMVWHHPRDSMRAYWRQQRGYGRAEALLERKWPEKYNVGGHVTWAGRLYGGTLVKMLYGTRWRIYYGTWGSGLFQFAHRQAAGMLRSLPLMPEWYLVLFTLAALSALSVIWAPLFVGVPLFAAGAALFLVQAVLGAAHASFAHTSHSRPVRVALRAVTGFLYVLQPLARLTGRLRHGLTPWRYRRVRGLALPRRHDIALWSEQWRSSNERLRAVEAGLRERGNPVRRGGDFDRWDLEVRGGMLAAARLRNAIEEHGGGRQLVRFRVWPHWSPVGIGGTLVAGGLAAGAAFDGAWIAAGVLGAVAFGLAASALHECATSTAALLRALAYHADGGEHDLIGTLRAALRTARPAHAEPSRLRERVTATTSGQG